MKDDEMNPLAKHSARFGMTVSNLLSVISLVILIFISFVNFRIQVANIESKLQEIDMKYDLKYKELERAKDNNVTNIERGRIENREEHYILSNKMDQILEKIRK